MGYKYAPAEAYDADFYEAISETHQELQTELYLCIVK